MKGLPFSRMSRIVQPSEKMSICFSLLTSIVYSLTFYCSLSTVNDSLFAVSTEKTLWRCRLDDKSLVECLEYIPVEYASLFGASFLYEFSN